MKKLFWYSMIPLTILAFSGCGSDLPPDKRQFAPPVASNGPVTTLAPTAQSVAAQGCKASSDKGCISGQVIVAPYIYLDGQKYFDAEDLGRLFTDMVMLRDKSGALADKSRYKIEISPTIDNEKFMEEFKVYAKGTRAAWSNLSSKGVFVLGGLDAGNYDLRVQKSFTMKVTQLEGAKQPLPPVVAEPKPTTPPVVTEPTTTPPVVKEPATSTPVALINEPSAAGDQTKIYCFTIYAQEDQMEIDAGKTSHKVFDHFKLHMIDKECSQESTGGPVITM